jgi:6,7-dimethyl-8-ribityllumazine synthase
MIKSVQLTALAKSEQDFILLTELMEALGLRKGFAGENENARSAEYFPTKLKLDVVYRKKLAEDFDLTLFVQDPDTALAIAKRRGLEVYGEHSGPEPSQFIANFRLKLPGGTRILVIGPRVVEPISDTDYLGVEGDYDASGREFAVIVSRFNSFITERLLAGALDALIRCGVKQYENVHIVRVPGAFEIPSAARTLALTKKYDAIVCLGCLLRGDTAHYDVIVNEVTRGIGQSAQETGVPHAFGVLTCETLEQAIDRAGLKMGNKGFEAALAAVEMANLKSAISGNKSTADSKKAGKGKQRSAKSKTKKTFDRDTRGKSRRSSSRSYRLRAES